MAHGVLVLICLSALLVGATVADSSVAARCSVRGTKEACIADGIRCAWCNRACNEADNIWDFREASEFCSWNESALAHIRCIQKYQSPLAVSTVFWCSGMLALLIVLSVTFIQATRALATKQHQHNRDSDNAFVLMGTIVAALIIAALLALAIAYDVVWKMSVIRNVLCSQ